MHVDDELTIGHDDEIVVVRHPLIRGKAASASERAKRKGQPAGLSVLFWFPVHVVRAVRLEVLA